MWVLGVKEEGGVYVIRNSHRQTQYVLITQF